MNWIRILCSVLALSMPAFCPGDPVHDAVANVKASLEQKGFRVGVSQADRTVTSVGYSVFSLTSPATGTRLDYIRTVCLLHAELKARRQIMELLGKDVESGESVRARDDSTGCEREIERIFSVFASGGRIGWEMLAASETMDDHCFAAAVAVRWSPRIEARLRAALGGKAASTPDGEGEMLRHLETMEDADVPGTRIFVDSSGFPHLIGIGVADMHSPLTRRRARVIAEGMAMKNLLLNLKGDSAFSRRASDLMSERLDSSSQARPLTTESAYDALAAVNYTGIVLEGVAPVLEKVVQRRNGEGDLLVVMCAYEPRRLVEDRRGAPAGERTDGEDVMIFNPGTGKFEAASDGSGFNTATKMSTTKPRSPQ